MQLAHIVPCYMVSLVLTGLRYASVWLPLEVRNGAGQLPDGALGAVLSVVVYELLEES